ncbi:hypothetical protein [Actinomadura keratinilytica]|uniref:hypothetical protein n=1 Tax=Actinomadura keratinilytica TaxID=547461 RepID=UPI0036233FAB
MTTVLSTDVEVSLVGAARFLQVFALVPLAVMLAVRERRHLVLVCGAVLAAGLFEAVYGIVQVATGNGASFGGAACGPSGRSARWTSWPWRPSSATGSSSPWRSC